jgi:hypothetical protein
MGIDAKADDLFCCTRVFSALPNDQLTFLQQFVSRNASPNNNVSGQKAMV